MEKHATEEELVRLKLIKAYNDGRMSLREVIDQAMSLGVQIYLKGLFDTPKT